MNNEIIKGIIRKIENREMNDLSIDYLRKYIRKLL